MEPVADPMPSPELDHGVLNAPKLLRLASMLSAGMEEARAAGDQAAVARAAAILPGAVVQAGSAVADDLLAELNDLLIRPGTDATERERAVVTAQLLGWLLGLLADPTSWVYVSDEAAA